MSSTSRTLAVVMPDLEQRHYDRITEEANSCGFEARIIAPEPTDADRAWLASCEILFTQKPKAIALCGPNLRWIQTSFAGIDAFCPGGKFEGLIPPNVVLTNNAGAYGISVGEHMAMLVLMLWRGEATFMRDQMRHEWGAHCEQPTIYGSTFGVLGCGNIGTTFARQMRGMGAGRIIGISKSGIAREEGVYDEMARIEDLDQVLPRIDVLAMSVPGSSAENPLLDARRLSLLPQHALVINAGRGVAINEQDLFAALQAGTIGGAGLDVFEHEPLSPESPLWDAPNCIITPHVAGNMTAPVTRDETTRLFCENLEHYARGEQLHRIVDLDRGY